MSETTVNEDGVTMVDGASAFLGAGIGEGVWVHYNYDYGAYLIAAFPNEVDALRSLNNEGYGRVGFLPWGKRLNGVF